MIFVVTYLLELHNVIISYYRSHFAPTEIKQVVWTLYNMNYFTGKKLTFSAECYITVRLRIVSDTKYHKQCSA
jgi:hypothetical protein